MTFQLKRARETTKSPKKELGKEAICIKAEINGVKTKPEKWEQIKMQFLRSGRNSNQPNQKHKEKSINI